ncbi:MAG: hypothetical protein HKN14_13140 [Marinicaulis sp.]|nr:hypothetical protein [Marinicaulis sp.]
MSGGLNIRLSPREKIFINGAILENGHRRTYIRIKSDDAKVLKMRDALTASEATTPLKRIYFKLQQIVAGEKDGSSDIPHILDELNELHDAVQIVECKENIELAIGHIKASEHYKAMKTLKLVFPLESAIPLGLYEDHSRLLRQKAK